MAQHEDHPGKASRGKAMGEGASPDAALSEVQGESTDLAFFPWLKPELRSNRSLQRKQLHFCVCPSSMTLKSLCVRSAGQ